MNAIADLLATIVDFLRSQGLQEWGFWSYPLLVLLVIIEGPIVTLLAAVAASLGYMRLPLVMLCALVGSAIADTFWYMLGYMHAEERILRYGRWLGLRRHHVEQLQTDMQLHAPKLLFFAKFVAVLATPTLIAAGLARVPFRRWFPIVFLGELIWVVVLVFIGYQASEVVRKVELGLHYLPLVGALALLALVLVAARRLKSGRFRQTPSKPEPAPIITPAPALYTNGGAFANGNHSANGASLRSSVPQTEREPTEV